MLATALAVKHLPAEQPTVRDGYVFVDGPEPYWCETVTTGTAVTGSTTWVNSRVVPGGWSYTITKNG